MKNSLCVIRISLITLTLLLLTSTIAFADFSHQNWRYVKDIMLPSGLQPDDLVELAPDREVYAAASKGLADLRIISTDSKEIPYKLEISKAEQERTSFPITILDKGYIPGSYNIFTADLGKGGIIHNEIEFRTPADDFRREATVETSNDGTNWMVIGEQTVYAFTVRERGFTTRDTRIRYPESTARYLRVKIIDDGSGSLDITGATAFFAKETPAREIFWESSILSTSRNEEQDITNVDIDLGTPGLPSYRLSISVSDVNFYREVTVQSSTDRERWDSIMRGEEIYSFDTPKFVGKSLVITYPETASRYLRLVIHDEDSPPLTIESVNVWGVWRRLVFATEPQQSYKLYYGNAEARKPSYDIEHIFPYLITKELPEATIGSQAANPLFEEEKPPVSERFPWLFPVVIAIAAIIVALLLLVIFRRVRKALPPPQE